MFDIFVKVVYGNKKEFGTGHLIRCLNIINYLDKRNRLKKIGLLIYSSENKSETTRIIKFYNKKIKIFFSKKKNSIKELESFNSELLIIDSLSKLKNLDIKKLKKINIKKKIFIFFGGFDKNNYTKKTSNILLNKKFDNFIFYFENKYQKIFKFKKNFKFYNKSNFYNHLYSSQTVICSGGLIMFDCIYLNKNTFCIPQYKHQEKNINKLVKCRLIKLFKLNQINKVLENKFNYTRKDFLTKTKINFTLNKINNIYNSKDNEHQF